MKISPLLAALGGGAAGLAMGGPNGASVAGLSPMLAMLLAHRNGTPPAATPPVVTPGSTAAPVTPTTAAPAVDPQRRALAQALLRFGSAQSPFGQRSY